MYTSVTDIENKKSSAKTAFIYLAASMFCVLFGAIYEYFSHEVYSYYMLYAFVIPLALGTVPYLLMTFTNLKRPGSAAAGLYASGIATLTTGSIFKGVLEIYGTTSRLTVIYLIAGATLTLLGIAAYITRLVSAKNKRNEIKYTDTNTSHQT